VGNDGKQKPLLCLALSIKCMILIKCTIHYSTSSVFDYHTGTATNRRLVGCKSSVLCCIWSIINCQVFLSTDIQLYALLEYLSYFIYIQLHTVNISKSLQKSDESLQFFFNISSQFALKCIKNYIKYTNINLIHTLDVMKTVCTITRSVYSGCTGIT